MTEKSHKERVLTDHFELHIIELSKFKEDKEKRPENDWIKFIKAKGGNDMKELSEADKALQEAIKEFERLASDPELREEYLWREKELRDKISFISSAREEGKEEGKEEIVLSMVENKFDIETICKITKLSEKEVEEIVQKGKEDKA